MSVNKILVNNDDSNYTHSIFDISEYTGQQYSTLSDALNDMPQAKHKGGMTVRYQTNDNKYVQYRLMSDEWSTNTENWAIADEGVYVDNSEYVYVKTDAEGKILCAIKVDGGIYYGAGVPQQIIDYINEKIAELSLDEYEDIVAFLNDYLGSGTTLKAMIDGINDSVSNLSNTKVDKVEGKSLIDSEHASTKSSIDNPEFLEVTTDLEDKILEGIRVSGTKVIGRDLNVGGNIEILGNMKVSGVSYKVIKSQEYLAAWVDAEDKVIFGLKADGKTYVGDADFLSDIENIKAFLTNIIDKNIDWNALSSITVVENPKFIEATTDSEGKLIAGRTPDGAAFENIGFTTPKVGIEGHIIENIKDPEGRSEITTDSEGRIISYRDSDGVKHEEVGIESERVTTNSLNLTDTGMTEFQKALKSSGFKDRGDWSDYNSQDGDYPLNLAMPRCAMLNIISDYDLTQLSKEGYSNNPPYWPAGVEGVTYDIPTQVEFFDMQGNYFKKWTKMSAQGNSSMKMVKKNIALDFFDDETMETAFKVKFGEWVPQDSFHIKAFYTDAFRCVSPVAYQLYDEMLQHRGVFDDYFWKRALIDFSTITATSNGSANLKDAEKKLESGAKCFPKGFPIIVYQNGEFWGVFSFQLKKHRDNYHQDKEDKNHIQLDGTISADTLFSANGNSNLISWVPGNDSGFEVRNPKSSSFVTEAGNKYDENATISQELAGVNTLNEVVPTYSNETTYSKGDKCVINSRMYMSRVNGNAGNNPVNASYGSKPKDVFKKATEFWIEITYTNEVKKNIIRLSTYLKQVEDADAVYEASEKTPADLAAFKEIFETFVDPKNLIDYLILADIAGGISAAKNWQWCTYDGIKWYIGLYDCDNAFGQFFEVTETRRNPYTSHTITVFFHQYIIKYYNAELEAWYKELRDAGIITVKHIVELVKEWQAAVGVFNMMLEYNKWPESTRFDSLFRLQKWVTAEISNMDDVYHYNQN